MEDEACFRVDNFRSIPPSTRLVFLTHFHADHYSGIAETLAAREDITVLCTETTRTLLLTKFRLPPEQIQPLQMCEARFITKPLVASEDTAFTITALPANHCPGSAALLFEFANGPRWLHTGDFRYTEEMQKVGSWKRVVSVDRLFLDTTFCNKKLFSRFPSKAESQEQIVRLIQQHHAKALKDERHTCSHVYVRCQPFGTEEVFIKIKESLGVKTAVSPELYTALSQVDTRFTDIVSKEGTPDFPSHSTTTPPVIVHACNEFPQKLEPNSLRIRASAQWSQFSAGTTPTAPRLLDGVWNVLYSGHSSWNELRDFVAFVKPKTITPLVKCDVPSFRLLRVMSCSRTEEAQTHSASLKRVPPELTEDTTSASASAKRAHLYDEVLRLIDDYNSK